MDRGGMDIDLEMYLEKQYVDGELIPLPKVKTSHITFHHQKIHFEIVSGDLGPQIVNFFVKSFLTVFIAALDPIVNIGTFPLVANMVILDIVNQSRAKVDSTMI